MTKLEHFFKRAMALPEDRKKDLEDCLERLEPAFFSPPHDWELSPEQTAELKRRLADPNPVYASQADVEALFGRTFDCYK